MTTKAQQIDAKSASITAACQDATLDEAVGLGLGHIHGTGLDTVLHHLVAAPSGEGLDVAEAYSNMFAAWIAELREKVA